jgi:hypothetical protein
MSTRNEPLTTTSGPAFDSLSAGHLIKQKALVKASGLMLVEQAAPVINDLFVSRAYLAAAHGQSPLTSLAGFAGAYAVQQLVRPKLGIYRQQWLTEATRHYERAAIDAQQGRVALWLSQRHNPKAATERTANDVPWVIGMLVGILNQGGSLGITLVTQALVLGTFVDPKLLYALAACCLVGCAAGLSASKLSEWRRSITENELGGAHTRYGKERARMWDNTLLGNRYNFNQWSQSYAAARRSYHAELVTLGSLNAGCAMLGQIASASLFGLTLMQAGNNMYKRGEHEALAAYFLPMVARAIKVLDKTGEVGPTLTQLNHHLTILNRLRKELLTDPNLRPGDLIGPNLQVIGPDGSVQQASVLLASLPTSGRCTVRGPNGAGKTMLMAEIKRRGADSVFLWPATHDLMFGDLPIGSSGQTTRYALSALTADLERDSRIKTIVLDEWDANLDDHHRAQISAALDQLAKRWGVIEVTHRPDLEKQS